MLQLRWYVYVSDKQQFRYNKVETLERWIENIVRYDSHHVANPSELGFHDEWNDCGCFGKSENVSVEDPTVSMIFLLGGEGQAF